ncbi:hypothetical protein EK21DRAFT_110092 [Setomelanomma holmii]|uniref:Uncharacterized protein n=1 Tax=Setomelanomma holmii TaxID=210430 RepID=A0A9P4HF36_9PLEO|nr:hypothetical protein EK21DRAFT_110092 [Setomelanomma holmii]
MPLDSCANLHRWTKEQKERQKRGSLPTPPDMHDLIGFQDIEAEHPKVYIRKLWLVAEHYRTLKPIFLDNNASALQKRVTQVVNRLAKDDEKRYEELGKEQAWSSDLGPDHDAPDLLNNKHEERKPRWSTTTETGGFEEHDQKMIILNLRYWMAARLQAAINSTGTAIPSKSTSTKKKTWADDHQDCSRNPEKSSYSSKGRRTTEEVRDHRSLRSDSPSHQLHREDRETPQTFNSPSSPLPSASPSKLKRRASGPVPRKQVPKPYADAGKGSHYGTTHNASNLHDSGKDPVSNGMEYGAAPVSRSDQHENAAEPWIAGSSLLEHLNHSAMPSRYTGTAHIEWNHGRSTFNDVERRLRARRDIKVLKEWKDAKRKGGDGYDDVRRLSEDLTLLFNTLIAPEPFDFVGVWQDLKKYNHALLSWYGEQEP